MLRTLLKAIMTISLCLTNTPLKVLYEETTPIKDYYWSQLWEEIAKGNYPSTIQYLRDEGDVSVYYISEEKLIHQICDTLMQIEIGSEVEKKEISNQDRLFINFGYETYGYNKQTEFYFQNHQWMGGCKIYNDQAFWDCLDDVTGFVSIEKTSDKTLVQETNTVMNISFERPIEWRSTYSLLSEGDVVGGPAADTYCFTDSDSLDYNIYSVSPKVWISSHPADAESKAQLVNLQKSMMNSFYNCIKIYENKKVEGTEYPTTLFAYKNYDAYRCRNVTSYTYLVEMEDQILQVSCSSDDESKQEYEKIFTKIVKSIRSIN